MTFALIRTDRADVVRPLCFTASPGRLPGLDHAPAALAGLPCRVSEVIFLRMFLALVEVGIGKSPALACDIALLWCISGGHLQSFPLAGRRVVTLRHPWFHQVERRAWDSNPR